MFDERKIAWQLFCRPRLDAKRIEIGTDGFGRYIISRNVASRRVVTKYIAETMLGAIALASEERGINIWREGGRALRLVKVYMFPKPIGANRGADFELCASRN